MALFSRTLLTTLVLATSASVVAQDVPVIELGDAPVTATAAPSLAQNSPQRSFSDSVPELTIQSSDSTVQPASTAFGGSTEMLMLLQQLQDEVRSLRGQLESQGRKLQRMEEEQRDRYRDLDRRISFLMTEGSTAAATPPSATASAPGVVPGADQAAPTAPVAAAPAPEPAAGAIEAYDSAFQLVRQRAYDEAIAAFTTFIKNFPGSDRVANAHYWLGELYLAQQKLEQARDSFSQVVALYADHRKAADAAYKLGKVYHELGDKVKSAEYIDLVLKNYPESSVAKLARNFKNSKPQ